VGADGLARAEPVAEMDETTGHGIYVTGVIVVSDAARDLPGGFGPGGLGVLLLHALGHLLGLGNVGDQSQVMGTQTLTSKVTRLGQGDIAGLRCLGVGSGCLQAPHGGDLEPAL
jgi:hypothetical protein